MSDEERNNRDVDWRALPPVDGGVYVGMITEVLDKEGIPNIVKTDLEAGGLGVVMGTATLGDPWRIQVPVEHYDHALEIYQSLIGKGEEGGPESTSGAQESV